MVIKEVKNLCFDLLKEKLVPLGYKPLKKGLEFTKLNDLGFDKIWFGTTEYAHLKMYKIYIYVSVRIDAVEQLNQHAHEFHDESQIYREPTCNINCGAFTGNPNLEFEIRTPEDVVQAVETFWNIYNEHAVEHIKKCYDIQFLNSIYPKYGERAQDWLVDYGWYFKVFTIAFLANKDTFPTFRKEFTDYLINDLNFPEDVQQDIDVFLNKITSENSKNNNG